MPTKTIDSIAPVVKSDYPKLDAFLTRVMLRLFNDSPGLSSYYDTSGVRADKVLVIVLYELPAEVLPAIYQAIGCKAVKVHKYGEAQQIKLMYEIRPTEQELTDLDLYPAEAPDDKGKEDQVKDPA